MTHYQVRFVDHGNRVFGTAEMDAVRDDEVIESARRIHSHGIGKGYEIWDGERRVHIEVRR